MAMVPRLLDRESSFAPYAELWNATNFEMPKTPEMVKAEAEHDPAGAFEENWLYEEGGRPQAYILMFDSYGEQDDRRLTGDILVRPERQKELASVLVDKAIESAINGRAKRYGVWVTSRLPDVAAELESRGFVKNQVAPVSRLELSKPIPPDLLRKHAAVDTSGLRFASIQELDEEGFPWVDALHESSWEMLQDMPHVEEPHRVPLDHYREMIKNRAIYQYELMFAALEGDRIVAYSRVQRTGASDDTVLTGLTGTVRTHRRRGLATALKAASIERMRNLGYRYLVTDNDETNPMFAINQSFGFEKVFEFWRYQSPEA